MPRAWRLVRKKFAKTAFDGEGAAKFGGRWNSPGTRIVYASETLSLAALETLVHLNPLVPIRYVCFPVDFDDCLVEKLPAKKLPRDWKTQPPGPSIKAIGDAWAREACSAVLQVPSVLVPIESNLLLNPLHPDFGKIKLGKPQPFAFDPRLTEK